MGAKRWRSAGRDISQPRRPVQSRALEVPAHARGAARHGLLQLLAADLQVVARLGLLRALEVGLGAPGVARRSATRVAAAGEALELVELLGTRLVRAAAGAARAAAGAGAAQRGPEA